MSGKTEELIPGHSVLLAAAIDAVETRRNWRPFKDSSSGRFYATGKADFCGTSGCYCLRMRT